MPDPDEAQALTSLREADALLARAKSALEGAESARDEVAGFIKGMTRRMEKLEGTGHTVPDVTGAVMEAMRPIVEPANEKMAALSERVEELAEQGDISHAAVVGHLGELAGKVAELAERAAFCDEMLQGGGNIQERLDALDHRLSVAFATSPSGISDGSLEAVVAELVDQRLSLNGFPQGSGAGGSVFAEPVPRVYGKVLELMRQVRELGKDGRADPSMGGYTFRSIDSAIGAVGTAMRDVGLTLETRIVRRDYVTDEARNKQGSMVLWTSCRLVIRYAFVDPTDGSKHVFEMAGEARATDDKSTSKAESMALKYGLIQALMIPVKDLADGDGDSPQVLREQPAQTPREPGQQPPAQPSEPSASKSRAQRARDAYDAMRALDKHPPERRGEVLAAIRAQVEKEGLGQEEVNGASLRGHASAIGKTLQADGYPKAF